MIYRTELEADPNVLPTDPTFQSLALDPTHDRIYALIGPQFQAPPGASLAGALTTFTYKTMRKQSMKKVGCLFKDSFQYMVFGKHVFLAADGSKIFVLAADNSGTAWGMATFDPE